MGTPPQTFEFAAENGVPSSPTLRIDQCRSSSPHPYPNLQVLAVTMVDDDQPIICDSYARLRARADGLGSAQGLRLG